LPRFNSDIINLDKLTLQKHKESVEPIPNTNVSNLKEEEGLDLAEEDFKLDSLVNLM